MALLQTFWTSLGVTYTYIELVNDKGTVYIINYLKAHNTILPQRT